MNGNNEIHFTFAHSLITSPIFARSRKLENESGRGIKSEKKGGSSFNEVVGRDGCCTFEYVNDENDGQW